MQGCGDQGCRDARMQGSKDTGTQGCRDARMQGCREARRGATHHASTNPHTPAPSHHPHAATRGAPAGGGRDGRAALPLGSFTTIFEWTETKSCAGARERNALFKCNLTEHELKQVRSSFHWPQFWAYMDFQLPGTAMLFPLSLLGGFSF